MNAVALAEGRRIVRDSVEIAPSLYLTHREMISRAKAATSEALGMRLSATERAMVHDLDRRVIEHVLIDYRDLSANGFWTRHGLQSREAFDADRMTMSHEGGDQFRRALAFLLLCTTRRKTINRRIGSYGLKHLVEQSMYDLKTPGTYCCNGVFIVAALSVGYTEKRIEGTPNCWFNISVLQETHGGRV